MFFAGASVFGQSEQSSIALKKSGDAKIAIPFTAFGQEYMMSTSLIPQAGSLTGRGLMGRIVLFERFDDSVDMYESTKGQVVTEDLPARRLLATFKIVSEDADAVVIDFNQGMRRLLYQGWYASSSRYDSGVGTDSGTSAGARFRCIRRGRQSSDTADSPSQESGGEPKSGNPLGTAVFY